MIDVWVTGSSLPALDAALALAEVGLRVRVSVDADGGHLPVGPQRDPEGALAKLVARVGAPLPAENAGQHSAPELRQFPPTGVLLRGADGALHPLDATAVLGIPTAPLATDVIALLGRGGAFRAYLDRLRPVLKIGKEQRLGDLVRSRIGAKSERLLVDPIVRERAGVPAAEVDAASVAPGLNEAMTRAGSLTGAALAYGDRNVARETTYEPVGGWVSLRTALRERLALYSVQLVEDRPVLALGRAADGAGWLVRSRVDGVTADEQVRGVIVDVGGTPRLADAHGFADNPTLANPALREYIEVGIERPEWLQAAHPSGSALGDARPAAEGFPALLELPAAGAAADWTVRVSLHGTAWRARFSGPRREPHARIAEPSVAALSAEAGLVMLPGEAGTAARWTSVASPVSVEEARDRQRAIVEFDETHHALRPVGAAWAGGEISLAVAEAFPRVVALRRELLGIA